jgi:hypothetical protein
VHSWAGTCPTYIQDRDDVGNDEEHEHEERPEAAALSHGLVLCESVVVVVVVVRCSCSVLFVCWLAFGWKKMNGVLNGQPNRIESIDR